MQIMLINDDTSYLKKKVERNSKFPFLSPKDEREIVDIIKITQT